MSSDGNFCSVLWPEQSEYAVYATDSPESTASWRELARGSAVSVAWAANSSTLAVLHVPKVGVFFLAPFGMHLAMCIRRESSCEHSMKGVPHKSTPSSGMSNQPQC